MVSSFAVSSSYYQDVWWLWIQRITRRLPLCLKCRLEQDYKSLWCLKYNFVFHSLCWIGSQCKELITCLIRVKKHDLHANADLLSLFVIINYTVRDWSLGIRLSYVFVSICSMHKYILYTTHDIPVSSIIMLIANVEWLTHLQGHWRIWDHCFDVVMNRIGKQSTTEPPGWPPNWSKYSMQLQNLQYFLNPSC